MCTQIYCEYDPWNRQLDIIELDVVAISPFSGEKKKS